MLFGHKTNKRSQNMQRFDLKYGKIPHSIEFQDDADIMLVEPLKTGPLPDPRDMIRIFRTGISGR